MQKTLLLLDAYALIYRAYFAFINRPIKTSKGLNTSAVFGFAKTLLDALKRYDPSHIAVAFDVSGKTFRTEIFPEYKANRQETPEDIRTAVPLIKNLLKALNISVVELRGYEADDIVGTIAKKAEPMGFEVLMMTPDKDYGQLLTDKVKIVKPSRSGADIVEVTAKEFCEGYGIKNPMQFKDILALWGDNSDNIPGVPGIGEKTASALISKYESIENIYQNISELSKSQQEKLLANREQLNMARVLVEIKTDVPVEFNVESFKRTEPNTMELKQILEELEFRSIAKDIFGEAKVEKPKPIQASLFDNEQFAQPFQQVSLKTILDVKKEYMLVDSIDGVNKLAEKLLGCKEFCFDTETTGLEHHTSELVGLSFSIKPSEGWYVPIPPHRDKAIEILSILSPAFENENIDKVGQNMKFDLLMLKSYGIEVRGKLNDTMIAHYLLEPDMRHNLNILSENYLGYKPIEIEELIGKKGPRQLNMRSINPERIVDYATEDADIALQLKSILFEKLNSENLVNLYYTLEEPLIQVLSEMEYAGVRIEPASLKGLEQELNEELLKLDEEIKSMAGVPDLNISSPKQLGEVLFERMKIATGAKKTKTKQYSTSEEELAKYRDKHPIIDKILDFRSVKKLLSTYVEVLPTLINKKTGRIHASFNQAVASTGRLSSNNPNLQNIPIREERGREIRKAFVPKDSEHLLLSADYSQIELRLMAHMSKDEGMLEAFQNGEDIHAATASKIFRVPLADVTREQRSRAKTANFGMIYGISAFGLSQRLEISRTEAKELIDGYFDTYKGVKEYMDFCAKQAREKGYVETIFGRKRYLPDINSGNAMVRGLAERNAINAPIQGSAADIIKAAMIGIHQKIKAQNLRSRMIIQVHDELVFDVYKPELDEVKSLVKKSMENAVKLSVPLEVDMGVGTNWLDAH
ncbi:MAG TPA: DNA polymerase I [Tenuifilaceae bacterium]|nr:DNA polymerase I [Tenuifilaceae bacterium]